MRDVFLLCLFGYGVQVLEDYKKRRLLKHPFFLTRQTYVAMLVTLGIDFFGMDNRGWLATFSPLSMAICFTYLALGRGYEELHSSSSVFGHVIMPFFAMYGLFENSLFSTSPNWYPLGLMLMFFSLHYAGQWVHYFWKKDWIYPEVNLLTWKGNGKMLANPVLASILSVTYMYVDLSRLWILYLATALMFGSYLGRAFMAIRTDIKPSQDHDEDEKPSKVYQRVYGEL